MPTIAAMTVALTATDSQFSATLGTAEMRLDQFAAAAELAGDTALGRLNRGQEVVQALDDELALLRAGNDQARQRIRLAMEYRDTVAAIEASQANAVDKMIALDRARQVNAEKLADVEGRAVGKFRGAIDSAKRGVAELSAAGAGIKMISATAEMAADSVAKIAREAMRGEKSAAELTQAFMDGLPIIGDATRATQSVVGAVQDTTAATLKWLGYSDQVAEKWMSNAALAEKVAEQSERTNKAWARMAGGRNLLREYENELALLDAQTDQQRDRLKVEQDLQRELERINAMGPNHDFFESQAAARAVAAKRLADIDKKYAEEAAKEKAKADEEASKAQGKRAEAEINHWLKRWDGVNDKLQDLKKKSDEEDEKLTDRAKQLRESVRSPAEILADKFAEIDDLLAKGKLDADTALEAANLAKKDAGLGGDAKPALPSVIERGSAEALANANRDVSGKKIDEQQLKRLEEIATTLKQRAREAGSTVTFEVVGKESLK